MRGLTQKGLAEKTGLHITTIANYEIDRREPKANQLKILAKALGIDVSELLETQINNKERGLARRYLVAEVSLRLENGTLMSALAVNVSREGIGIYTEEALRPNERVSVRLVFLVKGSLNKTTEEVQGSIRWSKAIGKNYTSGIRFDKAINKDELPILSSYLEYATTLRF
ncbi:MAG: helix-turn-helix domain-containing protein [Deltaproteobacteria bacterium]|nr:helix-turn-helix domain-containing protein [Deltaproteobacteria bacterium]